VLDIVVVGPFPEDASRIRGGVQASVFGLATTLAKRSDVRSVTVMSTPIDSHAVPRTVTYDGMTIVYLDAPLRFMQSAALHLLTILRVEARLENPVFHIHGTGLLQAALSIALSIRRIPYVLTLHGITEKETLDQYRRRRTLKTLIYHVYFRLLERLLLRVAGHIIVDTKYVAAELSRKKRVYVIPQGIFSDELADARISRRSGEMILSVGVFSPRKGHHLLLESFAMTRAKSPTARLTIVGALFDQAYHDGIVNRVAELGLTDAVALYPNAQRGKLLELLASASLFALHSQEESQGIALCEAIAAGLPVVATDIGGIPHVVTNNEDGILVPYGDLTGFSDGLSKLIDDDSLRAQMSECAKLNYSRFDWNQIVARIFALYEGVLPRAAP
jgi:glycosyltransferase involved in cell wall biosynthesis